MLTSSLRRGSIVLALTLSALVLLARLAHAQAPVPAGVPAPPFFPLPSTAAATSIVDGTNPAATDLNNPWGTAAKPRRTIPAALPAGAIVEVRGGPYPQGGVQRTITASGTATAPVVIRGVNHPQITGTYGAKWTFVGSYLLVEGLGFDNVQLTLAGDFTVLRDVEAQHHNPAGNSAAVAIAPGAGLTVLSDVEIHHNGDPLSVKEHDVHGVLILPGSGGVWILNSHLHHNGGDAVQVGSATSTEPWARGVWIAGNQLHEDRENAVDIKKSRDVVVLGNLIYGYRETSSSAGEGVVTHDNAERVWILNNLVLATVRGIAGTGAASYVVAGNGVVATRHNPAMPYDPSSLYGSFAIGTRDSRDVQIIGNTIWGSDGGIVFQSGNAGTVRVVDNVIQANNQSLAGTVGDAHDNWIVATQGDPQLVNPAAADLRPTSGSPLVDRAAPTGIWAAYAAAYGAPVPTDLYGGLRPAGGACDLGAGEYQPPPPILALAPPR